MHALIPTINAKCNKSHIRVGVSRHEHLLCIAMIFPQLLDTRLMMAKWHSAGTTSIHIFWKLINFGYPNHSHYTREAPTQSVAPSEQLVLMLTAHSSFPCYSISSKGHRADDDDDDIASILERARSLSFVVRARWRSKCNLSGIPFFPVVFCAKVQKLHHIVIHNLAICIFLHQVPPSAACRRDGEKVALQQYSEPTNHLRWRSGCAALLSCYYCCI